MEFIVIWLIFGIIGGMIGSKKGAGPSGFILGIILGPIGIIIALLSKGDRIQCPFCRKDIDPTSLVCAYCQKDLPLPPVKEQTPMTEEDITLDKKNRKFALIFLVASFILIALVILVIKIVGR